MLSNVYNLYFWITVYYDYYFLWLRAWQGDETASVHVANIVGKLTEVLRCSGRGAGERSSFRILALTNTYAFGHYMLFYFYFFVVVEGGGEAIRSLCPPQIRRCRTPMFRRKVY